MKRIYVMALKVLPVVFTFTKVIAAVPSQPSIVKVQGRQLIVQKRLPDNSLSQPLPYIVKGINWNPATRAPDNGPDPLNPPLTIPYGFFFDWEGRNPQGHDVMNYWVKNQYLPNVAVDATLMKQMNINTVRVFSDFGTDPAVNQQILDTFYNNGIMVILMVVVSKADIDSGAYLNTVQIAKNHPAILMWSMGNEWNYNLFFGYSNFGQATLAVNQAAAQIKAIDPNHVVTSTLGDGFTPVTGPCPSPAGSDIPSIVNAIPNVDVWGLNIYRGSSFGALFTQWQQTSAKPFYLSEFGTDSYQTQSYTMPFPSAGCTVDSRANVTSGAENQATQATFDIGLWSEIKNNLSARNPQSTCVGGLVFAFNDLLWKVGNYNVGLGGLVDPNGQSYKTYDPHGFRLLGAHPDDIANEEYFGVVNADRTPKAAFQQLQTFLVGLPDITAAVISSCGDIGQSGNYLLGQNLTGNYGQSCLTFHDAKNVHLDCQGHSVSNDNAYPVRFDRIDGFSMMGCMLNGQRGLGLFVGNSQNGLIQENDLAGMTVNENDSGDSSHLQIIHNQFRHFYQQNFTHNSVMADNMMQMPQVTAISAAITSANGSNNSITGNTIDGHWDGVSRTPTEMVGADDGILLAWETGTTVSQNNIQNAWDCGIETTDIISSVTLQGNTIRNSAFCGIGAWYGNSWQNNIVADNTVSEVPYLFALFRIFDLLPGETKIYFQNNAFRGNRFSSPKYILAGSPAALVNFVTMGSSIPPDHFILGNNSVTNNDFGVAQAAPVLLPAAMVIDGGNNICGASTDPNYPLACGRPVNNPPNVTAGADKLVTLSTTLTPSVTVTLNGMVTDDGLLLPVFSTWSVLPTGLQSVTFANKNALNTTATFTQAGTYGLQLSLFDGQFTVTSSMTVTVQMIVKTQPPVSAYYVSTLGDDSNSGAQDQPFLTIAKGVSVLNPGDTLFLRAGAYTESLQGLNIPGGTSWSNPVTLSGFPGEVPLIKPASADSTIFLFSVSTQSYIVLNGLVLDGTNTNFAIGIYAAGSDTTNHGHHIRIQNTEIRNTRYQAIEEATCDPTAGNEFIQLNVHDCGRAGGVQLVNAIHLSGGGQMIDHSHVHNNQTAGGIGIVGCQAGIASHNIIRYNIIDHNSSRDIFGNASGAGINLGYGNSNQIDYNLIHHNGAGGIVFYLNKGGSGTTISNNTIADNITYGIVDPSGQSNVIKNNILSPESFPLSLSASDIAANNLIGLAQFVSPNQGDYHLQTGSPAIDAGVNLGFTVDLDGHPVPQGLAPDLGAYEFTSTNASYQPVDRYVAPRGNDGDDGSPGSPWATLQHAADNAQPGMTIHVEPGTYHESVVTHANGTAARRIRYASDTQGTAKIQGMGASTVWSNTAEYTDIVGFDMSGAAQFGVSNFNSHVLIEGNTIHQVGGSVCQQSSLIYGGTAAAGIFSPVTLAEDVDVLGNLIHAIGAVSGACSFMSGIFSANSQGLIQNNIVHHVTGTGIHTWGASSSTVSNNLSFENNTSGIDISAGGDGQTIDAQRMVVTNNISMNNKGYGITEDLSSAGRTNRYIHNLVMGNTFGGTLISFGDTETGTVQKDPGFVNFQADGSGNYHLQAGSPAIDVGTSEGAPATDFDGISRPQGAAYDIGPYEYAPANLLVIVSAGLPPGNVRELYSTSLLATGGVLPYIWSISSGHLPEGLSINLSGVISGTPVAPGSFTFTVKVNDNGGSGVDHLFAITIAETGAGPSAAIPVIGGFDSLPPIATRSTTLRVQVSGTWTTLLWTFTPARGGVSSGSSAQASGAQTNGESYTASTLSSDLSLFNLPLALGQQHLSVVAYNGSAASTPAEGTFELVSTDLGAVRVHPSPWRSDQHSGYDVTFDNLPSGSTIKIFTVSGRWVKTIANVSGQTGWNLKTDDGDGVASGIYLYLVTAADGSKTHGKFAVIR